MVWRTGTAIILGPAGFGVNIGGMNINVGAGQTVTQTIDEHGNVHITIEM